MKTKVEPLAALAARFRQKDVDELGRLARKLKSLKKDADRFEAIKKRMRSWAEIDKVPASEAKEYEGRRYVATVSAAGMKRTIVAMDKVFETLGQTAFLGHCGFTLEKLDVLLPEAESLGILRQDQVGPRHVTVELKPPKEKAEAAA